MLFITRSIVNEGDKMTKQRCNQIMLIGLIWSIVYFSVCGGLIESVFSYSPFHWGGIFKNPLGDFSVLYKAFMYERLSIDTFKEFIFILIFIGFYPVWIWGWMRLCCFPWTDKCLFLLPKLPSPNKKIQIKPKFRELERPREMALTGWKPYIELSEQMVNVENQQQEKAQEISEEDIYSLQGFSKTSVEVMDRLKVIAQERGLEIFDHVKLGEYLVPLVLATDTQAFLFNFFDEPDSVWTLKENVSEGEIPQWETQDDKIDSPFYEVCQAAKTLSEQEPDSLIIPILVMLDGEISNPEELQKAQEIKGGIVLRGNTVEEYFISHTSAVPLLADKDENFDESDDEKTKNQDNEENPPLQEFNS